MKKITYSFLMLLMAMLALPASVIARSTVTFDFAAHPWTETVGNITEPIVQSEVTLTTTDGGTPTRLYSGTDGVDLRVYKSGGSFTFTAPEGQVIEKIEFSGTVAATAGTGTYDSSTKTWTQPDEQVNAVTFTATGTNKITKAVLTIAAKGEAPEVVVLPTAENIAAFKALETDTEAELTLTDAKVLYVKGTDMIVEDATGAIDFYNIGLTATAGQVLNGSIAGKNNLNSGMPQFAKSSNTAYTKVTVTDGDAPVAVEMTVAEAMAETSYLKYVKLTDATLVLDGTTYYLVNGDNKIQIYNKFKLEYTLPEAIKSIAGIIIPFTKNGTTIVEIAPIAVEDIVAKLTLPYGDVTSLLLSNPGFESCEANTTDLSTAKDAGVDYTEQGWKVSASGGNCNAAVYEYGSATILNSVTAPAADNAGNPGKAMGVTVAWSSNVKYTTATPITLPAGIYTIKINGYNAFGAKTLFHSNLAFVAEGGTVIASSSKSNFASNVWEEDVISFTLDTETTGNITFGGYAENKGSGEHAKVFFDNITIERFTELTRDIALLNAEIANAQKWTVLPTTELADAIASAQNVAGTATDSETVLEALAALQSAVAAYYETIAGGTYYLKNVATGKYLAGGSSWGTHAIVDAHGIDLGLAALSDGKYTIDTQLSNGGEKHYLNADYCDGAAFGWTFVQTTTAAGEAAFTISNGTNYLTTADGTADVTLAANDDDYSKWVVLSVEDRMAELQTATADNGKDASWLLPGRNFGRNDLRNSKWTGKLSIGGDNTNMCAERFNTTFDVYQTISVPNGLYKVEVQGFYRNGGYVDAAGKHVGGSEQLLAAAYANTVETPLQSIFAEAGNCKAEGTATTDGIEGAFPDNMKAASAFFTAGLYNNVIENVVVVDGTLTVGVRKSETTANDWSIFDNFRITYYGEIQDLTIYKEAYDAALAAANTARDDEANSVVTGEELTALSDAISTYGTVEETKDAYVAATSALNAATNAFTGARAAYQTLADNKAEYEAFNTKAYPYASSAKATAITEAVSVEEATSAADATAKAEAIIVAVRAFIESNAYAEEMGATDYTSSILNPNAEDGVNSWNTTLGEGSGGEIKALDGEPFTDAAGNSTHKYFDGGNWGANAWDVTFSQDVTLPSGEYLLSATTRASQGIANFILFGVDQEKEMPHVGNTGGIFNRGWNDNFVVFNVHEDNTAAKIGVRGTATTQHEWMSFTRFRLVRLGLPNAISNVNAQTLDDATVYSVNGQLVRSNAKSLNGLAKGVYVVNGKKVVVK